jgi:Mrp family chromosome partitioning ATPase
MPFGSLQVGDELLAAGSGDHLDELPAVLAPGVEDLLGRMDEQRHGDVLPLVMRRPYDPPRDWDGVRLHVVTGKGGTGKTTVAAALALALAGRGQGAAHRGRGPAGHRQLFDVPPLPYEERRIAVAPGGGEVFALAVDAEEALLEYLEMFYNLAGPAGC